MIKINTDLHLLYNAKIYFKHNIIEKMFIINGNLLDNIFLLTDCSM